MSIPMYLIILWMMMQLNAPSWLCALFWIVFAIDILMWILEKIVGAKS